MFNSKNMFTYIKTLIDTDFYYYTFVFSHCFKMFYSEIRKFKLHLNNIFFNVFLDLRQIQ